MSWLSPSYKSEEQWPRSVVHRAHTGQNQRSTCTWYNPTWNMSGTIPWECGDTGGTVTPVHRHAHRDCRVYQPSGFHGYPLTCAHLHPKPSERERGDRKTVKRTQVTGAEANADGFDGTGGREGCTSSMFLKKNRIESISRKQIKSYPARETVKCFNVGWRRSLLRCSLLYALGLSMNIKHSKQVISPLPTPFILAHLQKLPGVTGERAEKSGSGFGVSPCQGWEELVLVLFSWEGSALYTSVFLIWNVWLNKKKQKQVLTEAFLRALRE